MACVALVAEDVLAPRAAHSGGDGDDLNEMGSRFESALIRQVAVCCAQRTLDGFADLPHVTLCEFVHRLARNLLSLRVAPPMSLLRNSSI